MAYTTEDLITSIKQRGMIPTSQSTFTDANFLALADEETQTRIVPVIMSAREEYYVSEQDTAIGTETSFRIPSRAIGQKLREVQVLPVPSDASQIVNLPRIGLDELHEANTGFYVKGNNVVLVNTNGAYTGNIRLSYYLRPSRLLLSASVRQVTAINVAAKQVTIASTPAGFVTTVTYDLAKGSSGFEPIGTDLAVTSIAANVMTFTAALPSGLVVGDWVTYSDQGPIPQMPVEFHSVLAQAVVVKCLEALGDREGMSVAEAKLGLMEASALKLITSRVDGAPQKVVNTWSPFRKNLSGFWGFRR